MRLRFDKWPALLSALWLFSQAGCHRVEPPSILFITLDTTRADRLGCYGYSRAMTLAIDRLAAQGIVFENAFATVPLTTPSHASMLTGLLPPQHGIRINGEGTLSSKIPTVAEVLAGRGYRTGAFVGAFVLDRRFGLHRGFEIYDDDMRGGSYSDTELYRFRLGEKVTDAALAWLRHHARERFFCWVHFFDPHVPYDPHPEMFGSRFLQAPYDGEIAYVDVQVDRLLRLLSDGGLLENTLIIIAGDHGEGLDEHRERTHGYLTYNTTLRVPLIFHWPRRWPAARRVADPVSLADLAPTILDCAGIPMDGSLAGISLTPLLDGRSLPARRLYAETELPYRGHGWSPQYVLIRWPWKYIHSARSELFDLANDPHETNNLVGTAPERVAMLSEELAIWRTELQPAAASDSVALSESERRAIESLGYAAGGTCDEPAARDLSELTDMKDRIGVISAILDAKAAMARKEKEAALTLLREAVEAAPEQLTHREHLAAALHANGNTAEALSELRAILDVDPARISALAKQAAILLASGRTQEARETVERMTQLAPESPTTLRAMGALCLAEGHVEEAISYLRRVAALRPDHLSSRAALAAAYERAGRLDEARREREAIMEWNVKPHDASDMMDD